MAQQTIGIGSIANDGTGDPLRTAFTKINANDTELYAADASRVVGPSSATDDTLVKFDGTTGKLVKQGPAVTSFAATLLDDADAATARTTLGVNTSTELATEIKTLTNKTLTAPVISTIVNSGTLTLPTATGTLALTSDITGTNSGTNTGDQFLFRTIAVSGQSDIVADSTTDTLTLAAGGGVTLTTNATTDTLTIAVAGGVGLGDMLAANNLSDVANASTARTNLGLAIGTNVQAYDAELAAIAGLTSAADSAPYFTGSGTAALATLTTAGRALIDDASAAAQRTTMGVDGYTSRGDAIYTILATDRTVAVTTAFTAARIFTLPAANAVPAGHEIIITDAAANISGSNTLTLARAGSDTINNAATTFVLNSAGAACIARSDGTSKWVIQPIGAASGVSTFNTRSGAVSLTAADIAAAAYGPFTSIASATTTDLSTITTVGVNVTGTTTITSFGTGASLLRMLKFAGALTLSHNATSLILPGGLNITTVAGDTAIALSDASGNWTVVSYSANGAWHSYTPTVTCGSGAFTTVSSAGKYRLVGKTVIAAITVTITTNGTAAGFVAASIPITSTATVVTGASREIAATGLTGCLVSLGTTSVAFIRYDNVYAGGSGYTLQGAIIYEAA